MWSSSCTPLSPLPFAAARQAAKGSGDSGVQELLHNVEARDELTRRLQETFDQELLELATARVRARVEERTWEAYRLTALEGLSGAEAAARVGMQVGTAYKAKSKVHAMLQETLRELQEEEPV